MSQFKKVTMVIFQPRLIGGRKDSVWSQPIEELQAFGDSLMAYADATRQSNAALVTSDKGCKFCKAKAICPQLKAEVCEVADSIVPEAASEADLASCLERSTRIDLWLKAIKARAMLRLTDGTGVPGFKLVAGKRGAREWTDEAEAEKALRKIKLKVDQIFDKSLLSPTKVERLVKAGVMTTEQFEKLGDLITQPDGKPAIAPQSDKRPAIGGVDVTDDFDSI